MKKIYININVLYDYDALFNSIYNIQKYLFKNNTITNIIDKTNILSYKKYLNIIKPRPYICKLLDKFIENHKISIYH